MKVVISEKEVTEAVRQWCERRFPLAEKQKISWKANPIPTSPGSYYLEFTVEGVDIPPKDGPYR